MCSNCIDSDGVRKNYIHRKKRSLGTGPISGRALFTITGHLIVTVTLRATSPRPTSLESRVGVRQELLEVRLEPRAGLGRGLEGVGLPTVEVVPGGARVAGTIRLTAGLDPDEGILDFETSVGGWAEAETGSPGWFVSAEMFQMLVMLEGQYSQGVAPVSPGRLTRGLLSGAALVGDEVRVEPFGLEEGLNGLDIMRLVVVGVTWECVSILSSNPQFSFSPKTHLVCKTAQWRRSRRCSWQRSSPTHAQQQGS